MKNVAVALCGIALLGLTVAADTGQSRAAKPAQPAPPAPIKATVPPVAAHAPTVPAAIDTTLVSTYCIGCHNDTRKSGGLTLAKFDAAHPEQAPQVAEKMIHKLTAGMMPPPGAKRPEPAAIRAFISALETRVDAAAAANPNPGWRPFQRLNRAEYARALRDLLDLDLDLSPYLPPDTVSAGFDNVADVQDFSPTLLEGYLRAASQISRIAVGDRTASAATATYTVPQNESQMRHVDGTPFGTRGGLAVTHVFPADGDYVFSVLLSRTSTGELFGNTNVALAGRDEEIEISINGVRAAVLKVNAHMSEADKKGTSVETPPIRVSAGPQQVSAAFIARFTGPVDDLMAPIDNTLVDLRIGTGFGITMLPHVQDFAITGPLKVTGISETPSRRRIFTCRPTSPAEEVGCAESILKRLATQAFRGTVNAADFADIMAFYKEGRSGGDFEAGIRLALQGLLAHPRFLFRVEQAPAAMRAGQPYRVRDTDLASRLSFFLWDTVPDQELLSAATQGTLRNRAVLEKQVRRMLQDPKAQALATRFAAQWLRLQDVDKIRPDGLLYPYWDKNLSAAMRRETELLFEHLVRNDRPLLELLTADYSFINDRLARHYGIPGVAGAQFRKVTLPANRRGILGQGSVLLLTSVADRTSPVQRGKWIMQVLLGSPPPPPPPNVPPFDETRSADGSRVLSVRERMEEHRKNPACNSCHRVIDPLGLALENYDATGKWRIKDNGVPVDPVGDLYDGTKLDGPNGLRDALLAHKEIVLRTFTESLMTYALGRRVEYYDMPTVRAIVREAEKNDYRMSSFVLGVINSPAFKMTRPDANGTETAAQERER